MDLRANALARAMPTLPGKLLERVGAHEFCLLFVDVTDDQIELPQLLDFAKSRGWPLGADELIGLADANASGGALSFLAPQELMDLLRDQASLVLLEQGLELGESAHRSGNFYGRVLSMAAV